jgi:glutamate-1-semialdehyde 2,1-aminomutase
VEMVRLVNSGTEAVMSAIRLARGATGRDRVLKFEGCYHGHSDPLLAAGAGSGLATLGIPSSAGVTEGAARDTITVPYNDLEAVAAAFGEWPDQIAVVVVEPVAANMGVVSPEEGFLGSLRELCTRHGALLLFDEVITGFRIAYGGAQTHYGVTPDLTTLGKVMGGGFPCAAFGGTREVMEQLAPTGPVYQAGTLSGNPVAVAAGTAALDLAKELYPYADLAATAERLTVELGETMLRNGIPTTINRAESLFSVFFTDGPVRTYEDARAADHQRYGRFFHHMLRSGVYLPPSGYELLTLGTAHGEQEIAAILHAATSFTG